MTQISFEVFPPRTPEAQARLQQTLEALAPLNPRFVSVTCGAGGSAADATFGAIQSLTAGSYAPAAGHLTCVGRSRAQSDAEALRYWEAGVRHMVILRGDAPAGQERFAPYPDGYRSAVELVAAVRAMRPFEISVAAYPEPHPESRSPLHDLRVLAHKAEAGASRAITQFCFDSDAIVNLRDRMAGAGIPLQVVPGILLASDFAAVTRMAGRCGATVPSWLAQRFAGIDNDAERRSRVAADIAASQVEHLRREGFDAFHFYTLNQAELAHAVCGPLAFAPAEARSAA